MRFLAVDDEPYILEELRETLERARPAAEVLDWAFLAPGKRWRRCAPKGMGEHFFRLSIFPRRKAERSWTARWASLGSRLHKWGDDCQGIVEEVGLYLAEHYVNLELCQLFGMFVTLLYGNSSLPTYFSYESYAESLINTMAFARKDILLREKPQKRLTGFSGV